MKVGDKVRIVNADHIYPAYTEMFDKLGFSKPYHSINDIDLDDYDPYTVFTVVAIAQRSFWDDTLYYGISDGVHEICINIEGIELI